MRKIQSNVISSQSWACSGRFCQIKKCPLHRTFPWNSSAFSLREVKIKVETWVTPMDKHRNHLRDHMVSREEKAPGALVCPGTWRLRTSLGWALADVTRGPRPSQNPCGHCDDFRTQDKEACRGQLGVGLKEKCSISSRQLKKRWGMTECHLLACVFFLNLVLYWEGEFIFYFYFSIC